MAPKRLCERLGSNVEGSIVADAADGVAEDRLEMRAEERFDRSRVGSAAAHRLYFPARGRKVHGQGGPTSREAQVRKLPRKVHSTRYVSSQMTP